MTARRPFSGMLFPGAVALLLLALMAVHFRFDPYRTVRTVAASDTPLRIEAGARPVTLARLDGPETGALYRVAIRARRDSVVADEPAWRSARIVFASFDGEGRWIPAPHVVAGRPGSGAVTARRVFGIPAGAAAAELVMQHFGLSGSLELETHSLEEVVFRRWTRPLFVALRIAWFLVAGWTAVRLGLHRRPGGGRVLAVAGLIAVAMSVPGRILTDAPEQVLDRIRPPDPPAPSRPADPETAPETPRPDRPEPEPGAVEPEPDAGPGWAWRVRTRMADALARLDPHFWGHVILFFLLGLAGMRCFVAGRGDWRDRMGKFGAGAALFAVAAEFLQAVDMSRAARLVDVGVNLVGLAAGIVWPVLFRLHGPGPGAGGIEEAKGNQPGPAAR